jgi:acyl-coenzyme A thioesterase PaaI-like protein
MPSIEAQNVLDTPITKNFIKKFMNPFNQWLFLWAKLPAAAFMGVRVRHLSPEKSEVTIPFGWRSQNPFKSIYFAAQAAAAEMSTGIIASMAIHKRGKISMLVADMRAEYSKKANRKTTFTCSSGQEIFDAVQKAIDTGEGQTVTIESIGTMTDTDGNTVEVSRFYFTWTFKVKK